MHSVHFWRIGAVPCDFPVAARDRELDRLVNEQRRGAPVEKELPDALCKKSWFKA